MKEKNIQRGFQKKMGDWPCPSEHHEVYP